MEAMAKLAAVGVTAVVLSAVLRKNTPELALATAQAALTEAGMTEGRDYLLTVAARSRATEPILF